MDTLAFIVIKINEGLRSLELNTPLLGFFESLGLNLVITLTFDLDTLSIRSSRLGQTT